MLPGESELSMAALSIREMNISMARNEWLREELMKLSALSTEPVYYWHVFRKIQRGKGKHGDGLKFVRDFTGTKAEVAALWLKYFHAPDFKLRCLLKY
jgi:hypothetical protein